MSVKQPFSQETEIRIIEAFFSSATLKVWKLVKRCKYQVMCNILPRPISGYLEKHLSHEYLISASLELHTQRRNWIWPGQRSVSAMGLKGELCKSRQSRLDPPRASKSTLTRIHSFIKIQYTKGEVYLSLQCQTPVRPRQFAEPGGLI